MHSMHSLHPVHPPAPVPHAPEGTRVVLDLSAIGVLVVSKPAGVLSVPGRGPGRDACVASWVRAHFPAATGPIIVHRLDMETSGLMIVALHPDAHRAMSGRFERREVHKRYEAIVAGPGVQRLRQGTTGQIELPLRADLSRRPLQMVDRLQGRSSRTRYRVLALDAGTARLELEPVTGRSHQLRVHCHHPVADGGLGAPIVGDRLYGGTPPPLQPPHPPPPPPSPRLMLHACELATLGPAGEPIRAVEPVPF